MGQRAKPVAFAVGSLTLGAFAACAPPPGDPGSAVATGELPSCTAPANAIQAENCLPGTPQAIWDLPGGAIDTSIEGFATDISVNRGETVSFKVRTAATAWRLDIYRLGFYQGNGARLVATVRPSVRLPQSQPACLTESSTGLLDCGNWAVSTSWAVPSNATSGLHVGKLVREDTGGSSHVVFVVRDDASRSDVLFVSSDTTWQSYNDWGGKNLYGCGTFDLSCRAFKVSYNRPFRTRQSVGEPENWLFNAEYPLIRWLEANGYDVSYSTATDSDRRGALIRNHKVFVSNGHDEYWSAAERANVEAARDAGVNLAFFSSNTMFWKIRREPSIDGSATPYRTQVCYKETHAGAKIDPLPDVWTGTWRDPRFSPPADGGRPENALLGTIFRINGVVNEAIAVPSWAGRTRFWRNTEIASLAPGTVATLAPGTLGAEVDVDWDNGFRPPGLFGVSETPLTVSSQFLLDYGSTYGAGSANHNVTFYRHASGALVWAAGSYQWAWGLDANHDRAGLGAATDVRMQQATVNLLADMGAQPVTLQPGLVPASPSTDGSAPLSSIDFPLAGSQIPAGSATTIRGRASDVGGVVTAVEVSTDGGATWHPAIGRESWTYDWVPSAGIATIRVRAVDDSANLEQAGPAVTVTVGGSSACTGPSCSLWAAGTVPGTSDGGPDSAVELGVRFRSDVSGWITGVRFYKSTANTGPHVANLWTATGTRLATATFASETASGWQQASFPSPVPISANTTYVASYHAPGGHYAADEQYFAARGVDSPPLHAPQDGTSGGANGVYAYGASSAFPSATWRSANYWVDVAFTATPPQPAPLAIATSSLPDGVVGQPYSAALSATGGRPPYTWSVPVGLPPGLALAPSTGAISGTPSAEGAYTFTVVLADSGGATATKPLAISMVQQTASGIWPGTSAPTLADSGADAAVTLGVKFRSDLTGVIGGIRFYKSAPNVGPHVGSLWTSSGTLLAQATFSGESASGWQTASFSPPVPIAAQTVYVASYHCPAGHYAADMGFFTGRGVDAPPLHALASGVAGPNGVFRYGSAPLFPDQGYRDTNYWVDVLFEAAASPTLRSVAVTPSSATLEVGTTRLLVATATYSDGSTADATAGAAWSSSSAAVASVGAGGVVTAFNPGTATISATVGGASGSATVTVKKGTPPPSEGPGGQILVVTHVANPFSRYLVEILRAEGFAEFVATDVSLVTSTSLAAYDVVILGEFPLTAAQASMFVSWVNGGGRLVAMRPDRQLAPLLGLADAGGTLADAYLRVDTTSSPGDGIVADPIQFHGTADLYALAGATPVAMLYSSASAATSAPAVTLRTVGNGRAAAFTYDLARSIVYTRQGNPEWSGQERDGFAPIRPDDLFFGGAQAPDWVNLAKAGIPQADEQQRLLANLLVETSLSKRPLPRFWYFPSGHKAVVVMTGDDHGGGGTAGRFETYLASSTPGCSVPDWQCIRSTSYVYPGGPLRARDAVRYGDLGFEVALHVNTGCVNWTSYQDLDTTVGNQLAQFAATFPGVDAPATARTHCIVWSDYDTEPLVEAAHGIRLDTNYYYWPGSWIADRPGFMTGSGIPMRMTDRNGRRTGVYQAATQMTDESEQSYPFTPDRLLDAALGPEGFFGAFTANLHTDSAYHPLSDAVVGSARTRGVPIVSARQLLEWLEGRDASSIGQIAWSGGVLRFAVNAAAGARNLEVMVPAAVPGAALVGVTRDGASVPYRMETVKGVQYAFVPAASSVYAATYR